MSNSKEDTPSPDAGTGIRRGPYPEFTWTAIFVGWAIGALTPWRVLTSLLIPVALLTTLSLIEDWVQDRD